jgi:signal transduction histidine kinase
MADSIRRAVLVGILAWNTVSTSVLLLGSPRVSPIALLACHVVLLVAVLGSLGKLLRFDLCLAIAFAVSVLDFAAARSVDDAITLATCWLSDLLYVAGAIALTNRARAWLPLAGSAALTLIPVIVSPVWELRTTSAFFVTAVAIMVAARLAMPSLWQLAGDADENVARLDLELRTQEISRRAGEDSAEDARLIHDTVINTLGAVANGGHGTERADLVRTRCQRDLAIVEGMLQGRRTVSQRSLSVLASDENSVLIERTGLSECDLRELELLLAPAVVDVLVSAAEEAVRNAAKHAGVERVTVDVARHEEEVVVTVSDEGIGFDTSTRTGTGIRGSIHERLRAVGGNAVIESEPGAGTRVRASCPLQTATEEDLHTDLETDVLAITVPLVRRACWLVTAGILGVGFVIEASNRPGQVTWTYAMLLLGCACAVLAYASVQRRPSLPAPVALVLALALPAGFLATMAGVDLGRHDVLYVQAIGIAPLLIMPLTLGARRWALLGTALLIATAVVLALVMGSRSLTYGAVTVVAVLPSLGLAVGWRSFQKLVTDIVTKSEQARRRAFTTGVAVEAEREIAEARRRWGTASLERAWALLYGIGSGGLDVGDDEVRRSCGAEEEYLRQLLLLSPAAYRMSSWFAHALAAARSRGVHLMIRSGDQDAPDNRSAQLMGRFLLDTVDSASTDAEVSVGWFPTNDGPRLIVVGPRAGQAAAGEISVPQPWMVTRTVVEDRQVVEIAPA